MSGTDTHAQRRLVSAILGSQTGGREAFADALARLREHDAAALDELHSALVAAFDGGAHANELCECAVVLGLANLELAHDRGLDVVSFALHAARNHRRAGAEERALELCDLVVTAGVLSPELTRITGECQAAVRRRRHGVDQELLHARRALAVGSEDVAREHLARLLDQQPDHAEGRALLDGLAGDAGRRKAQSRRARLAALALVAVALPIGAVSMAHVRAARQYADLARPMPQDLLALERRIADLSDFADAHPLWWGRSELDRELEGLARRRDALESELRESNSIAELERATAEQRVEATYLDARTALESGNPHAALALLESALESGVPSPQLRARLRRDIAAIRDLLAEGGTLDLAAIEPAPANDTLPPAPPAFGPNAPSSSEDER
jgi:hypothetical protein